MTKKLTFYGIVQGIGFRPSALRIAGELGIKGEVKNSGGNVKIIISGDIEALDKFVQRLVCLFEIKNYSSEIIHEKHYDSFKIVHSDNDRQTAFLTPDLATCKDCEGELFDKSNRRYMHPFISCVNCGARYSIMKTLPYDRENITMSDFELCDSCKNEYEDAQDRRCHAQTIACNRCGPRITMRIDDAVKYLADSQIIAVKSIGGYHLACTVDNPDTVKKLRRIKGREKKPFAVMFRNLEQVREYCIADDKEEELLTSSARPIVLLKKLKDFDESVCSDSDFIGAFLPSNPIELMILDRLSPLIMTSANISGEPIITDDEQIKEFGVPVLSHNREILTPLDDSVVQVVAGRTQFIRRARGYVPLSIDIGISAQTDTLAMGGDLKAAFAFQRDNYAFLSQYFGDLQDMKAYEAYKNNIDRFKAIHSFNTDKIVCDKHPAYYSSSTYKSNMKIQHHKAHIASVIAEHKLKGDVLGFAFDGTGYGDDGAVWGSEIIKFSQNSFERLEHLEYVKMLAGDEISKNADLALYCYLGGNSIVDSALKNNINTVSSSSMGRLFDAVASLLDICHYNDYEGQCAIALENAARRAKAYYLLTPSLNPTDILKEIKKAADSVPKEELALGFHIMLSQLILRIAKKYNIKQIALSGGVFNNRILSGNTIKLLEENNFEVYINEKVPNGDGGIALGQLYISALEE